MNVFERVAEMAFNEILIFSGLAWVIAQIIKITTSLITERKFRWDRIFGDGGMPSGHSATVCSLATLTGWTQGFDSALFAMSMIFAIIVMNDAVGVRREAGKHAASIKELTAAVNSIFKDSDGKIKSEKLKLLIGHTPLQVVMGAVLGIAVAVVCILIFKL